MTGFRTLRLVLLECALVVCLLSGAARPSNAEQVEFKGELIWPPGADPRAVRLLNLYTVYCVIAGPDRDAQLKVLEQSGMEQLKGDYSTFIGEGPGKVWGASDATGGFLVVLSEARGCTVVAEHVNVADAERLFEYLTKHMPMMTIPPIPASAPLTKITDDFSDDQLTHEVRYETDVPDTDVSIWFTLATFQNPKASAEAYANLTLVRKE